MSVVTANCIHIELAKRNCNCGYCNEKILKGEIRTKRWNFGKNEFCHKNCMIKVLKEDIDFLNNQIMKIIDDKS